MLFHALNTSNHRPVCLDINDFDLCSKPTNTSEGKTFTPKTAWHKATAEQIDSYRKSLDDRLSAISVLPGCLCRDNMCKNTDHCSDINSFAENIVNCMVEASGCLPKTSLSRSIPGWNDEAKPLREKALFWHQVWVDNGKPRNGLVADIMRRSTQ